ncbi:MAG: methylenetetrahydrofolate reductase [NAD(P)H] [Clostridiales bacterium]|nr:methylenetetrahydrofolate reductase [NAD(P)H] [Clostridiales bacterium]
MFISEKLKNNDVTVSFEIFPPKKEISMDSVFGITKELTQLKPEFISVTYGAGGGTSKNTVKIASHIQNELNTTALAHLTCVSSTEKEIDDIITQLKENKIENVLALRGDIPKDSDFPRDNHFNYAYQLINKLKACGDFCIGAACYPEGHIECQNKEIDIKFLKQKVDCGVDFLTTQMFFDNNVLYSFLYRALANGIDVPVVAGIMPVTNAKQIARSCQLSGTTLPPKFKTIVGKFGNNPEAMKQAGIAYAIDQIVDLIANGVKGIHIYTMNRPEIAREIMRNISDLI